MGQGDILWGGKRLQKFVKGPVVHILLMSRSFLKAIQNMKKLTPDLLLEGQPKRWCDRGFL